MDWQSAQNLLSSSSSRLARTAWYRSTSFTDLPVMARVPGGQRATRPPRPQKPLPQSRGEDSRSPTQGHLLSGGKPSPPPRARPGAPSLVRRARPPLCSPSVRRPLAGSGKGPSPEEAAGLETFSSGKRGAQRRPPRRPVCGPCVPRLGFPGSCRLLGHHLGRLLPAALPLHLHPAQPAHAPRPYRVAQGSFLGSASQEPIGAEVRGGAWGWVEGGVGTPLACPWKRMNGAWQKASVGSGRK